MDAASFVQVSFQTKEIVLDQSIQGYKSPGQDIEALIDAPLTPLFRPSPSKRHALVLEYTAAPPLEMIAQPFVKLGGLRIDTRTGTSRSTSHVHGMKVMTIDDGEPLPEAVDVEFPDGFKRLSSVSWSPSGSHVAISAMFEDGLRFLLLDVEEMSLTAPLDDVRLNDVLASEIRWLPGGQEVLLMTVPADRGDVPKAPLVPASPMIQETRGRTATVRTYQDLLKTSHDEDLLTYFGKGQIAVFTLEDGSFRLLGEPGMYSTPVHSPDGEYILVRRIAEPYSYSVPLYYFASELELWDGETGEFIQTIASLPVAEEVPQQGVRTGPRAMQWQPLEPAQLFWAEALDGGDPLAEVEHREQLMLWNVSDPEAEPAPWIMLKERFQGATWLDLPGEVLITEYDRDRRWITSTLFDTEGEKEHRVIFDRSAQDRYNAPGAPLSKRRMDMTRVAIVEDGALFLVGPGASPEGDRPFMDRFELETGEKERLFEASEDAYEAPMGFGPWVDGERTVLFRRESPTMPPNYFMRLDEQDIALTDQPDPHPSLTGVHREILRYTREDGVPLSGTLYLPKGYKEGDKLPLLIWAYPLEYKDVSSAGQVRAQPTSFTRLAMTSPLMFLARGYAVLDRATMPIVGDVETMNETFVEQITQSAQAAIDAVVERGVADRHRVGVAGHSYGAFMTANLLAHTDLFAAAIARSGAYNRSLTPFGFQGERRSLWEAPEMYSRLSPFFHADKIKAPLLLIHGEEDPNSGTFPLQSRRLFHALQGLGGTARLVVLPHEGHGYKARESVLHVLAEQFDWFDEHVKHRAVKASEEEE